VRVSAPRPRPWQANREGGSPAADAQPLLTSLFAGDPPSRSGSARHRALFLPCSHGAEHSRDFPRHTATSTAERHGKTVIKTVGDLEISRTVLIRLREVFEHKRAYISYTQHIPIRYHNDLTLLQLAWSWDMSLVALAL
jgi:hypothetical protein